MDVKPTFSKPQSSQAKKLNKTIKNDFAANDIDQLLSEKAFSVKRKIFSLGKMEALVFNDPKLTSVYEEMAKNGEEKYGYHYNETIMNIIFNDYVLNSPRYLAKYKMTKSIKKRRRDKSGINQLKKAANPEEKETAKKNYERRMKAKTPEDIYGKKPDIDETTMAGASSGAYVTPNAWSKTGKPEKQKKPFFFGGKLIGEGKYLTDPTTFFKFINEAILNKEDNEDYRVPINNWSDLPSYKKIIEINGGSKSFFKIVFNRFLNDGYISCYDLDELASKYNVDEEELETIILKYYFDKFIKPDSKDELLPEELQKIKSIENFKGSFIEENNINIEQKRRAVLELINDQDDENASQPQINYIKTAPDDIIDAMYNSMVGIKKAIDEKAKSVKQQQFFGMVHALQNGELNPNEVGDKVKKTAKSISKKDAEDFAATKHKGLPKKVPEKVEENMNNEWQGVDIDLETSLFDYGFVAKQRKDKDYPDEWFILYKIDDNHYGWAHIREADLDALINGTDWLDPKDIEQFLSSVGETKEEWLQESFVNKLSDLLRYWGPQNLFGVEYHPIDKKAALDIINNNNVDEAIIDAATKHKGLPEKVEENMNNEWQGVDVDPEISLFEYGFVTKQRENKDSSDEWFVLYKIDDNHYGYAYIKESELNNLVKGSDWMSSEDIEKFLSYVGTTTEEWLKESFVNKLSDLLNYWGIENLFGIEYSPINKNTALDIINNNNVDEAIIDAMDDSMKMKTEPTGTVGNGLPTGPETQSGGGNGMMENKNNVKIKNNIMEDFNALNKELKIVEKYQKKLEKETKLFEERKPSALVLRDRMGNENEKNFKSDFNKSDTKQQVDVQKELQWKDEQTDVKDPQKLGKDLEKNELKNTKGEALKNVGNSANDKGDEVPKRNRTEDEQDEVDLYKKGLGDYVYDNEPDERFEKRMENDMGEKNYKLRKARQDFEAEAPAYNKDTYPTEKGEKKVQYDKEHKGWNDRFGLKESILSGAYKNAINKLHTVTFKLNEVKEIKDISNLFKLNFDGLSNLYDNYGNINEDYVNVTKEYDFYTDDGKNVYVHNKQVTESKEKIKINENEYNRMKYLMGYNNNDFVNTHKNFKTNDIIKMRRK